MLAIGGLFGPSVHTGNPIKRIITYRLLPKKISGVDIFAWITGIFTVVLWTRLVEISYGSSAGRFTIRLNMRKRLVASSIPLIDISVTGTQQ